MNSKRRKELEKLTEKLEELKCNIEALMEEEQEAFDNMPESLQYAEKGEAMEENITELENAAGNVQDAIDCIMGVIER